MRRSLATLAALALLGGCAGGAVEEAPSAAPGERASAGEALPDDTPAGQVSTRIAAVQQSLDAWRDAGTLDDAQAAADRTRLLITGPDIAGLRPIDADGVDVGLLPDEDGGPGLASAVADCAGPDLLGGAWDDPERRWDIARDAIAGWAPDNNTFPALPSHAQRVVGWATLTLGASDLAEARDYSGHAQLHVDASRDALGTCR